MISFVRNKNMFQFKKLSSGVYDKITFLNRNSEFQYRVTYKSCNLYFKFENI